MYLRGDKVKHTKKPEWGSGIVLEDEKDHKVGINFRNAGKKTISTAMKFLHIVSRGNLNDNKSATQPPRLSNKMGLASLQMSGNSKGEKQCCIFAIKTLVDLRTAFKTGGRGTFTEGRSWRRGRLKLLEYAKSDNKDFYVVFANADSVWDLLFYAKLNKIEILPNTERKGKTNSMSRYSFEDMKRYPKRRPPYNKTDLLVDHSGEGIPEGYRRSYVICRKPDCLI